VDGDDAGVRGGASMYDGEIDGDAALVGQNDVLLVGRRVGQAREGEQCAVEVHLRHRGLQEKPKQTQPRVSSQGPSGSGVV